MRENPHNVLGIIKSAHVTRDCMLLLDTINKVPVVDAWRISAVDPGSFSTIIP